MDQLFKFYKKKLRHVTMWVNGLSDKVPINAVFGVSLKKGLNSWFKLSLSKLTTVGESNKLLCDLYVW